MTSTSLPDASVLIVDDDAQVRQYLRRLLGKIGYDVHEACDGETAVAVVDRAAPDLVLLDVGLPGMDGVEVCQRLKGHPTTRLAPVVLMTGGDDQDRKLRGIAAGADDFINKPIEQAEFTARVASLIRLKRYTDELESAGAVMISLALTVEARDPYTEGHCGRLASYASMLGRRLGLPDHDITVLWRGAYLHDLGKIAIADAILQKPSALTSDEFALMQQHTVIGERLCSHLRSLAPVLPILRHHHERSDGSGYPDGLRGDAIPLLAQIVAIVDVYDAITTTRPYRVARSQAQAFEELTNAAARGLHRRDLIEEFIVSVAPQPAGSPALPIASRRGNGADLGTEFHERTQ